MFIHDVNKRLRTCLGEFVFRNIYVVSRLDGRQRQLKTTARSSFAQS